MLTVQLLSRESSTVSRVLDKFRSFDWHLGLSLFASLILTVATVADCIEDESESCSSETGFGLVVGTVSVFFVVLMFFIAERLNNTVQSALYGLLVVLWIIVACVLTIVGPFEELGNGYFASWAGLLAATLLVSRSDLYLSRNHTWILVCEQPR